MKIWVVSGETASHLVLHERFWGLVTELELFLTNHMHESSARLMHVGYSIMPLDIYRVKNIPDKNAIFYLSTFCLF